MAVSRAGRSDGLVGVASEDVGQKGGGETAGGQRHPRGDVHADPDPPGAGGAQVGHVADAADEPRQNGHGAGGHENRQNQHAGGPERGADRVGDERSWLFSFVAVFAVPSPAEGPHNAAQHAEEHDRRPEVAEQRALDRLGQLSQRPVRHVDEADPVEGDPGDVQPGGAAGLVLAVDVVDIAAGVALDPLSGRSSAGCCAGRR